MNNSLGLEQEFSTAELGDKRLTKRAMKVAETLSRQPQASFPRMFDGSGLEGFYRFVHNPEVEVEDLIKAHAEQTAKRASSCSWVVVAHDTTKFEFDDGFEREGLGWIKRPGKSTRWKADSGRRGFFGHFSLAINVGEVSEPLGVLAMQAINRLEFRDKKGKKKLSGGDCAHLPAKESERWIRGIRSSEERLGMSQPVVHVQDREGDSFAQLSCLIAEGRRFVIRVNHDRKVISDEAETLREHLALTSQWKLTRTVELSKRKATPFAKDNKRHAPRQQRPAELTVRTGTTRLKPPAYESQSSSSGLPIHVVWVREDTPPTGDVPVEWLLYTSEEIDTPEAAARVVDAYRARWLIEEFFKALKTGCQFEERNLESYDALLVTLGLLIPVAWKLLELRYWSRCKPNEPATRVFEPTQIDLLRALSTSPPLSDTPTLKDALRAIAQLGGHQKNNGDPGWLVLGRGIETLLHAEIGWRAAHAARNQKM